MVIIYFFFFDEFKGKEIKPLSVAVEELYNAKIKILNEDDAEEELEATASEEAEEISDMESANNRKENCDELFEEDETDTTELDKEQTVLKEETDLEE